MQIPFFDRVSKREQRKPLVDVAEIVSLALDPFGTTLITSLLVISQLNIAVTGEKVKIFFFLFLALIIPLVYFFYSLKTGKIKDIFITDRKERYTLLIIVCVVAVVFNLTLWAFGAPKLLMAYSLSALLLTFGLTLTTFFWKISGHSSVLTLNVLTLVLTLGSGFVWLLLLVPLVSWSRVILKVHTLEQVVAGAVVSAAIFFGVFSYFGLVQLS